MKIMKQQSRSEKTQHSKPRRTGLLVVLSFVCLTMGFSSSAMAEQKGESAQLNTILKELKMMRQSLTRIERAQKAVARGQARQGQQRRAPKPPATLSINVEGNPRLGSDDAPVTLVEFVDYECGYCKRFFKTTYLELKKEYIDTGKVQLVVRDLPLGFHANAKKGAQLTYCAREQGKYWPLHNILYDNIKQINDEMIVSFVKQHDMDLEAFQTCANSTRYIAKIEKDAREAQALGINGTPGFIIGLTNAKEIKGKYIRGALPLINFKKEIDLLLNSAGKK